MYKYHTYMSHYDPKFDLKINEGHSDLFHVLLVILPYILKTTCYINFIIMDHESI